MMNAQQTTILAFALAFFNKKDGTPKSDIVSIKERGFYETTFELYDSPECWIAALQGRMNTEERKRRNSAIIAKIEEMMKDEPVNTQETATVTEVAQVETEAETVTDDESMNTQEQVGMSMDQFHQVQKNLNTLPMDHSPMEVKQVEKKKNYPDDIIPEKTIAQKMVEHLKDKKVPHTEQVSYFVANNTVRMTFNGMTFSLNEELMLTIYDESAGKVKQVSIKGRKGLTVAKNHLSAEYHRTTLADGRNSTQKRIALNKCKEQLMMIAAE